MRYLHSYNEGFLDKIKIKILFQNGIKNLCLTYDIKNYTINSDGSIDVDGDVDISPLRIRAQHLPNQELKKLPLKFGEVTGNFDCSFNQLTTLKGAPQSVGGHFDCSSNKLTTLEGAPKSVNGGFYCSKNKLTTLEGVPKSVGGHFDCQHNKLTTLKGAPKLVYIENFYCNNNKLTTLEGAPISVCDFNCNTNNLLTLEGSPKSVGGNFLCYGNPLAPVRILFPNDKTFYKLCMEWEFFAGGNKIWKHRFLEAMLDIGKELPESIPDYEYI